LESDRINKPIFVHTFFSRARPLHPKSQQPPALDKNAKFRAAVLFSGKKSLLANASATKAMASRVTVPEPFQKISLWLAYVHPDLLVSFLREFSMQPSAGHRPIALHCAR
jgi:hypothetical protein